MHTTSETEEASKQTNKQLCTTHMKIGWKTSENNMKKNAALFWQFNKHQERQLHGEKSTTPKKVHAKSKRKHRQKPCVQKCITGLLSPKQTWSTLLRQLLLQITILVTVSQSNFCEFLKQKIRPIRFVRFLDPVTSMCENTD